MRSASLPPARAPASRSRSRRVGGCLRASVAGASLLVACLAAVAPARAQFLRGTLSDRETATPDDPTRTLPRTPAPAVNVAPDLLGLGETVSPLDPAALPKDGTDAAAATASPATPDLTRTGTVDPRAATRRGSTAGRRTATTRTATPAPGTRVAPVAPATPPEETGRVMPTAAIRAAPPDPDAATAEEAVKEDAAYAPLGLRVGGMTWLPAIEIGVGGKSNVDSAYGGRSSSVVSIEPELVGRSDWSRHALEVSLRGGILAYPNATDQSRKQYAAEARGRLELGDLTRLDAAAGWTRQRETTSVTETATAGEGTDRESKTLTLGLTREVGAIGLTLRGEMARSDYFLNGGLAAGAVDPSIQNNTRWTAAFRTTLGPTHTIAPFVEVQTGIRRYDAGLVYGLRRDGDGAAAKIGLTIDTGPTLRGEVSTGWGYEKPADAALSTLSGWLVDGNLTWSPNRLVVVKTKVRTSFEPTTNAGSPGSIARAWTLDLDWALRRDLTASIGGGYDTKHYFGIDVDERTAALSAGLTYKFDRTFQTFVRAKFEHVTASNAPTYDVGTVMTGIRIQR
jgi:hypothetical protein